MATGNCKDEIALLPRLYVWLNVFALASAALPAPPTSAPLLGLWEARLLAPTNSTPFDAASLGTWLEVTAPDGSAVNVTPFFAADFARSLNASSGEEVLAPSGAPPHFAVRFAPRALGAHSFVQRFLATPPAWLEPLQGSFECVADGTIAGDGFARVDARAGAYFTLDGEKAFFLVGEDMAWAGVWPYEHGSSQFSNGTGQTYAYDRWLPKLAAVGGNFIRLWIGPSLVRQPTYDGELGTMLGLALHGSDDGSAVFGEYNLKAAWRIDYIVELCRRLGVKIALVIDAQQSFCDGGPSNSGWCFWPDSIYNVKNGGPLSDPALFFNNSATMLELRQRWSYIVARWGYSTSIFSWELANEQDDWPAWKYSSAVIEQQAAIARWLPTIDPNTHMVDNSFGGTRVIKGFEDLPEVAFTSVHSYDNEDFAQLVWDAVTPRVPELGKPCFVEEFGASWQGPNQHSLDPTGIGQRTGAWASLIGHAAGTAMQWWWNEVDTLNTYSQLEGAATLSRSLATQLLAYNFSIWDGRGSTTGLYQSGWTVGRDPASGNAALAMLYAYNVNYTWAAQQKGRQLNAIAGGVITLDGVPLESKAVANAVCYNTSTGLPLSGGAAAGCGASISAGGTVVVTFPTFSADAAAVVTFDGSA